MRINFNFNKTGFQSERRAERIGSAEVQKQEPININHRSERKYSTMKSETNQCAIRKRLPKKLRQLARPDKQSGRPSSPPIVKENSREKQKKVHRKIRLKGTQETKPSRDRKTRYAYNFDSSFLDSCSQYYQGKQIKQEFNPDQQLSELSETSSKILAFKKKNPFAKSKVLNAMEQDIMIERNKLKHLESKLNKRNAHSLKNKDALKLYSKANQLLKTYPFTQSETHYLLDDLTDLIANDKLDLTSLQFQVFSGLLRKVRRKFIENEEKIADSIPSVYTEADKSQIIQIFTGHAEQQLPQPLILPQYGQNIYSAIPMSLPRSEPRSLMNISGVSPLSVPQLSGVSQPIVLVPILLLAQPSNSFEQRRPPEKY